MQVLFEAIWNRFKATALASKLTELHNTEAPPEAVFPYGVFSTNITADWTFTETSEDCMIMFVLFSKETLATEVCAAFEALKVAFDFHDLAVVGYEPVSLERGPANMIRVEKIWQYSITYKLVIQKGE